MWFLLLKMRVALRGLPAGAKPAFSRGDRVYHQKKELVAALVSETGALIQPRTRVFIIRQFRKKWFLEWETCSRARCISRKSVDCTGSDSSSKEY